MSFLHNFWNGVRALFREDLVRRDMEEEIATYLRMSTEEKIRDGMNPAKASRAARVEIGSVDSVAERLGDVGWESFLDSAWQDLAYTIRTLLHSPRFATVAILTLALGIGANTAVFSVLDAALLKSLPVRDPGHLVSVRGFEAGRDSIISYPVFKELTDSQHSFIGLLASSGPTRLSFRTTDVSETQPIMGALVSTNYFPVLGVDIGNGRGFLPTDDDGGSPAVGVISYRLWKHQLGGNRSAIGSSVVVNSTPVLIVGIASPAFQSDTFGIQEDIWLPLTKFRTADLYNRGGTFFAVLGRLGSGITLEQAQAELTSLYQRSRVSEGQGAAAGPKARDPQPSRWHIELDQAGARGLLIIGGHFSSALVLAMSLVILVLCVASANIATLLLARASSRQHEIGVRLAVGCTRARLVRQLLIESIFLALIGAVAGSLLAYAGTQALARSLTIGSIPIAVDLSPDARVLGFVGAICIAFGILFGLAPALRGASVDVRCALGSGAQIETAPRQRLSKVLVSTQLALSLLLLVTAGLLVRSFQKLRDIDPGFDRENVIMAEIHQDSEVPFSQFQHQLHDRMLAIPGVGAVSFSWLPLLDQFTDLYAPIFVSGYTGNHGKPALARYDCVSAGYFQVIGMPLVTGRGFSTEDRENSPDVVVVNESFVREFLPGQSALGKFLTIAVGEESHRKSWEIVGVVKDAKYKDVRLPVKPLFYAPIAQLHRPIGSVEVRTTGPVNASILGSEIRQILRSLAPQLTVDDVVTVAQQVERPITQERIVAALSVGFGLLALVLACVGLYGLLSYLVIQRRGEIGIRMALGAGRPEILRLISKESLVLVLSGVTVGLLLALATTRAASSLLYGLSAIDVTTISFVTLLLLGVAAFASVVPAYRATKVDPLVALRYE